MKLSNLFKSPVVDFRKTGSVGGWKGLSFILISYVGTCASDFCDNFYSVRFCCFWEGLKDKFWLLVVLTRCLNQRSFIFQMEWAPFKSLFWRTNDSIANLTISFTRDVSFWDRHLLLKYVNSWQRQRMPKTYDNIKLDFLWLQSRYWLLVYTQR